MFEEPLFDYDDIPDILHKWLEHESAEQLAYLADEAFEEVLADVLSFEEAVLLILYLCSMYGIGAVLKFEDGGSIIMDADSEEEDDE